MLVMGALRRTGMAVLVFAVTFTGLVATAGMAGATSGDVGYLDQSYSGAPYAPTSDKPQSKLWFAQGSWWADMFDTVSGTWHIFRLDRSTQSWGDTGVTIDDRPNTLADVLWDGTHLYVASHVVTVSSETTPVASLPNSPARLYRYSYSTSGGYSLDRGFPATISTNSSESMTLDKDSTGSLWATWTQVTKTATGFTSAVYANSSTGTDASWGAPFVVPVTGSTVSPDDISTVVAFGRNKVGVMWSNQLDGGVYWAVHNDGAARTSWAGGPAIRGNNQADDHLNIKAVQADTSGRVFAVVKTSLDQAPGVAPTDPQIRLLSFKPGTGAWSAATVSAVADCHTRPMLMLDEAHATVHVFATAPSSGGCSYSGVPGTIYDKTSPMDNPAFAAGRGTPVIRDAASANMNDVTSSKQSVTAASGIVVLASNQATKRYWHADLSATAPPQVAAPTASFTVSATSGQAPLPVQFTDTSTGSPTAWSWNFGDGSTATTQNPAHTYATAGTYTVTLTATNAGGSTQATSTTTVSSAAPAGAIAVRASSTASSATAVTDVTVPRPVGVRSGDVLVAQVTSDAAPDLTTVPSGWTSVLLKPLTIAGNARVFVYSHAVADASVEPTSYTWGLSAAEKWGAGITAFSGVDTASPFDSAASTAIDATYTASSLTVPGVTTVTAGAALIGGVGLDNKSVAVTQPAGWTEVWESTGGQVAELARSAANTVGPTRDVTWTLSGTAAGAGWIRALRPAVVDPAPSAPPAAPTASFTTSTASGRAPLPVQFTDTSTGSPTSWTWNFGDGSAATTQNPPHTYTAAGTYTVTLTAANAGGPSAATTGTITVTAAAVVPKASFTTPTTTGQAPLPVQFTDTSTGSPTSWTWNFGDGSKTTKQNPSHTYTAAGTYTVTLAAANATGSSTATTTIVVKAPAPAPGNPLVELLRRLFDQVLALIGNLR
jgi:PKD repeat protein